MATATPPASMPAPAAPAAPTSVPAPAPAAPVAGGGGTADLAGIVAALQGVVQQLTALVAALQAQGGAALSGGGPAQVPGQLPTPTGDATQGGVPTPTTTTPTAGTPPPSPTGTPVPPAVPTNAPATPTTTPAAGGYQLQASDPVLVIGDSLSVGAGPGIKHDLAGHDVTVNARVGRPLAEGMAEYDKVKSKPKVVEMGLGTNDDPTHVAQLQAAVEKTIADARARGGRVVWSTIHRAPVGGHSYDAMNAMLRAEAQKHPDVMGLVDWEAHVTAHPDQLAGDHIHGNTAGYAWRAQAYADAARG